MKSHVASTTLAALVGLTCLSTIADAATPWTDIECPVSDENVFERYESAQSLATFDRDAKGWTAFKGGQQASADVAHCTKQRKVGDGSMRIDFKFDGTKKLEYVEVGTQIKIDKPGLGLGMWVRGDGLPLVLRIRLKDRSGETHQLNLGGLGSHRWEYVAVMFSSKGGVWGGDRNRKIDYPATLYSVVADRPGKNFSGSGSMWVDDVNLVRPAKRTGTLRVKVRPRRIGNLYRPGERIELRAEGDGDAMEWRIDDFEGRNIEQGRVEPAGATARPTIEFTPRWLGHFSCRMTLIKNGRAADTRIFRCAVIPDGNSRTRNGFVGVCTHFQRSSSWPIEGMGLLKRYGITEMRDEIGWAGVEHRKGAYSLPAQKTRFLDRARELGIKPLMIFCYSNPNYEKGGFPNTDVGYDAFANWCKFMTTKLHDKVDAWEVWNEWSVGCGMGGKPGSNAPELYTPLLLRSYDAVKRAVPDAFVVGIGGEHSDHHFNKMEVMMETGSAKAMDAFSVHSYRYPRGPEVSDLYGEILRVRDMSKKYGAPQKIWVTEIGWPTHTGGRGVDERTQAQYVVRTLALLQATKVVEKVHWYDFKNDGLDRAYNECNFGVVWHQKFNWAPKPAVVAMSVFAKMTAGIQQTRLWQKDGCRSVTYERPNGTELVVAWSVKPDSKVRCRGSITDVQDIMGNRKPDRRVYKLGPTPVYVSGRSIRIETR